MHNRTESCMTLRILHYSDIENAYDDPERIGRLAGLVETNRDEATLLCGTGDTTAPGLLAMETEGDHALPFFDAITPDFETFGNHDFDIGLDTLRSVVERSPQTWLVANLYTGRGEPFATDQGVRPTAVTDVGGTSVGLVGVTDPETVRNHAVTDRLTVTDPVSAVGDAVDTLHPVDVLVVLSHAGTHDDDIAAVAGVDLVLGGHLHDRRANTVAGTPVVHPGARGEALSTVLVDGETVECTLQTVENAPVDTDLVATYREMAETLGLTETVARTDTSLRRSSSHIYPESPLGNFVADAYRWLSDADVAVFHPLMLRTGPALDGEVSVGDLRALAPFDNELYTTELAGEELVRLFESIAAPDTIDIGLEVFGHVSGAHLTWRRTAEDVELVEATIDGERPTETHSYTVVAPGFEFSSDIYPPLSAENIQREIGHQHEAVVEYAREHGVDTKVGGRMRATEDTAPGELHSLR